MMQLQLLKKASFDVGFFQEVNPLLERSSQIEADLNVTVSYQSDLVGVKVLGMGFPSHLNSGLLITAQPQYQLRRVGGVKLSGPQRSFVSPWLSFQLQEERYALMGELMHPSWGRVLVVNTHLHHGLELTEALEDEVKAFCVENSLSSSVQGELFDRLLKGGQRRLKELKRLLGEVKRLQERYSVIILGGDLNAPSGGELGQLLKEYGFLDSFALQDEVRDGFTFHREKNLSNHRLQARFPLSVKFEDLSFSKKITLGLQEILTRHEQGARRIDQLWVKSERVFKTQVELVGFEEEVGFAPSDHFGYLLSLTEMG